MFDLTYLWQFLSIFGDLSFWLGSSTAALIVYRFIPEKSKKYMNWFIFGILPAVVLSYFVTIILKFAFAIPRPCNGLLLCPNDYSFPSTHVAVIFSVATVFLFYNKNKFYRFLFFLLAMLVVISRLALGVHRIEDVIVGSLIGITIGTLMYINHKEILHFIHDIESTKK